MIPLKMPTQLRLSGLIVLMVFATHIANACLIVVLSSGDSVLVGNHEDWFDNDAQVRIYPSTTERFGSVIFTFASEGWAQGGMNAHGLFFDGAFTPMMPMDFDERLADFDGYIWQEMLDKCRTVDEALKFLQKFRLSELEQVTMVLADAQGQMAQIGSHHGSLGVHRSDSTLLQTNFNPWHSDQSDPQCERFQIASRLVQGTESMDQSNLAQLLAATHQGSLTVYSNIYDLKNRVVHIYHQQNYSDYRSIDLTSAMTLGYQETLIQDLFSGAISKPSKLSWNGLLQDAASGTPVPYANVGISGTTWGTLSDSDGNLKVEVDGSYFREVLQISALGYTTVEIPITQLSGDTIVMRKSAIDLPEAIVIDKGRSLRRNFRQGWMKGRHGVLPVESRYGGGALAVKMGAPNRTDTYRLDEIWVRILYNSEPAYSLRLRVLEVDSMGRPGEDLLVSNVILRGTKRIGWEKFQLREENITLNADTFYVAIEWINEQGERDSIVQSLKSWERWKRTQLIAGNPKIEKYDVQSDREFKLRYRGDMRDWDGFSGMRSIAAIVIDDVPRDKTKHLRSYLRMHTNAPWIVQPGAANIVLKVKY